MLIVEFFSIKMFITLSNEILNLEFQMKSEIIVIKKNCFFLRQSLVTFYCLGWSTVVPSGLTAASASWVQVTLLLQPPK